MDDCSTGFLAIDPEMRRLRDALETVAPTPLPVLILGETGTGKEVVALRSADSRGTRASAS